MNGPSASTGVVPHKKIRVLHIFNRMDRGGAETWIMNVYRKLDREKFQFDFLVQHDSPGSYDSEIRALGGRVIPGAPARSIGRYISGLSRTIRDFGPYEVVHSHVHHFSGVTLAVAKAARVPVRIAHSHNDLRRSDNGATLNRILYSSAMKWSINQCATTGFAVSKEAAVSLFGSRWGTDDRIGVLHCGVDLEPFHKSVDGTQLRSEMGLPPDAFVIGHVGSFTPQKNHTLLIEVFARIAQKNRNAYLLLLGGGPREKEIRQQIEALGLTDRVILPGVRTDVPEVMKGAMDCFFLPSLYEGIPLVLMEAQAAGLPAVISDTVTDEGIILPHLFQRRSLSAPLSEWVSAFDLLPPRAKDTVEIMAGSTFNVQRSADVLALAYQRACK